MGCRELASLRWRSSNTIEIIVIWTKVAEVAVRLTHSSRLESIDSGPVPGLTIQDQGFRTVALIRGKRT